MLHNQMSQYIMNYISMEIHIKTRKLNIVIKNKDGIRQKYGKEINKNKKDFCKDSSKDKKK